jgi:hypothetical protein
MTLVEALALLTTPTVSARMHQALDQLADQTDVDAFRAAMRAEFADHPAIQVALQTFWRHYATAPLGSVVHIPLRDSPDASRDN